MLADYRKPFPLVTPHGGTLTQLSPKPIETRFGIMKDLMSEIIFEIIVSGSKEGL